MIRVGVVVVLLYIVYTIGAAPAAQSVTGAAPERQEAPAGSRQVTWAEALANDLGNPDPSADILRFINGWIKAEGTAAAYNPLATSQPMPGSTQFNSHNVQNFVSVEQGLEATVITLHSDFPGYAEIVEGIRTNDVRRAYDGLVVSPWGTIVGDVARIYNGLSVVEQPASRPTQYQPSTADSDQRIQAVQIALSQVGKPYTLGTQGPDTFDCSGLMQWSYRQLGREITRTTFSQQDALPVIDPSQVQTGDMVYFQYSWDQHVGMLADIDGDGTWDMVHAAAPGLGVIVTNNVFGDPFYTTAIIGYRTAF